MKRRVTFIPAYDHRGETPNYGQHPMEISFVLRGRDGAVVFTLNTGWYIDHKYRREPDYFQLTLHSEVLDPHFEEDNLTDKCGWLDDNPCLADIIDPRKATALFEDFLHKGEEWLWTELEKIYKEHYE